VRIDLYGSTPATTDAIDQNKVNTKSSKNTQAAASTEDTTSLSSVSQSVESLTQTALQTTPTRQARVENLRQAVNNAQYQLDAAQIADSLSSAIV
jgi:flagellar biosynthesis anti-sigma factor FlgM